MPKGLCFTAVVSSFFLLLLFSTPNLVGHWTDLNQTWTHLHLWLLFEKFGPNSQGIYPIGWGGGKTVFGDRLWTSTEHISATKHDKTLSTIGKTYWYWSPFNTWFLGPRWVSPRVACRSFQPFLHSLPVCSTHRHTDHAMCDICNNRPHLCSACRRCGLIYHRALLTGGVFLKV